MNVLNSVGVFVEANIQLPMQVILDSPMLTQSLCIAPRRHASTPNKVPNLVTRLVVDRPCAPAHAHGGQVRPRLPVPDAAHILYDYARAFLLTAVALFPRRMRPHR